MAESKIAVQVPQPRQALLFELDESLAAPLTSALAECQWQAVSAQKMPRNSQPGIVFCSPDREVLARAFHSCANLPVVVVSRLPEVDGWLDALEAGAADYMAAPFETPQLRWLLQTHTEKPRLAA
jgi:DNA-binding NtrC family response regulator